MDAKPIYLDCNATTPIEPHVCEKVVYFIANEFGNAASRTHAWGSRAQQAVQAARSQVAKVVSAKPDEVIFTSGATESNNLALLGLAEYAEKTGRKHIISSPIEHKAVIEPLEQLQKMGFDITFVDVGEKGWVNPSEIEKHLRDETLAVSIMSVNNETGIIQPLNDICEVLDGHDALLHTDAAQGFGKELDALKNPRIDLISISGHKIYAPKGIGALVLRRRGFKKVPLNAIMFGGGHERGLRPGTLPVHLIVGLGEAAEMAIENIKSRKEACKYIKKNALEALLSIGGVLNGDENDVAEHVINISFPGVDSEAAILVLKDIVAISNGSACTSQTYDPSHVLVAMGLDEERINSALRISWCHLTPEIDWDEIAKRIESLKN